jgi:hypothetical protein
MAISQRTASSPKSSHRMSTLLALAGIAVMSSVSTCAYCQSLSPFIDSTIYVDELTINWDYYQGYTLYIEGLLECLTNMYCNFVPISVSSRIVWVDLRMLSDEKKHSLLEDCRASCDMIVRGQVSLTNISAWDIWKKGEMTTSPKPH